MHEISLSLYIYIYTKYMKICVWLGVDLHVVMGGLVKTIVFPVVIYGCKIWTIKKAEC